MWRAQARYKFQADSGYTYQVYYTAKSSMEKWTGFVQRPAKAFNDNYFFTGTEAEEYGPFTFVWNQASEEQELFWWIGYSGDESPDAPAYDFMIDDVRIIKSPMVEMTDMNIVEENITMKGDEEFILSPEFTPANASISFIQWSSEYDSVATVNSDGQIMTSGGGQTWLYAEAMPWGLKDSVLLTVEEVPLAGISFMEEQFTISSDETVELDLIFDPAKPANHKIDWYSSNNAVATVDNEGIVTGVAGGKANIFAISDFRGFKAVAEIEVISEYTTLQGISLNSTEETIEVGGAPASLQVIFDPPNATEQGITWSSEDESIATVDSTGKVTAVGNGTVDIIATSVEGNYTATAAITVITRVRKVSLNTREESLVEGETYQLVATIIPETASNPNVTWASEDETVVTVDNTGLVTAVGPGEAAVSVTTEDKGLQIKANFTVIPTSVEDYNSTGLILYPNPAGERIYFESNSNKQITRIDLYDMTGHLLKSLEINSLKAEMEVGYMNEGIYILKVSFNNGNVSRVRFLKQ